MAANYLHGVETIEINRGSRPVQVVKSAVIALTGIAPEGPVNEPTLVLSPTDAAQFGEKLPGFTIPQALDAIFKQGPATVIVVNTFSLSDNTADVELETHTIVDGKLKLNYAWVGDAPTIFESDGITPADLEQDVDYTLDEYGNFRAISAAAADGTVLKFTYVRLEIGNVTDAQIIGEIEAGSPPARTGMKCLELVYTMFGFTPKIILCNGFSDHAPVATEMIAAANAYRGIALLDAPEGVTPSEAITGRGPAGTVGGFNTSSDRAYLLYPWVKVYDVATDSNINTTMSQFVAGVISKVDLNEGYWFSPSNHEITGLVGLERLITAGINNPSSEANLLNEKGIATIFNSFGTGLRLWGNRSAAWPTTTEPKNFICVRRVADILHESVEYNMMQFIDKPIVPATIDAIRETVNAFIRTLVQRGALVDGRCIYNPEKNPPEEIALGHLTFDIEFMPPTPAERITFESFIDINLLQALQ